MTKWVRHLMLMAAMRSDEMEMRDSRLGRIEVAGPGAAVLRGVVFAGLIISTASALPEHDKADGQHYAKFWTEKIKPAQGKPFLVQDYRPKASVPPAVMQRAQQIVQSELQKSVRKGDLSLDPAKQLTLSVGATHGYTELVLDEEVFDELSARASEAFKGFLDYVGRPDLLPGLDFRLMDKDTEFEAPTRESAIIYLAWNRMIHMTGRISYQGDEEALKTTRMWQADSTRGQLVGVCTGAFHKDRGLELRNVFHHAYGGVGYSAISSYAVPMSELFPLCLREEEVKRVTREINEAWKEQGSPLPFKQEDYQHIVEKWDVREDSVVETLIDEFIGSRLDELGFTQEEWTDYCRHGNNSQYVFSPAIREKIREVGAPEVLRMWMEEPESLFQGLEAASVSKPAAGAGKKQGAKKEQAVLLKDDRYRAANFVVWCYSVGRSAVVDEEGVLRTSMLFRRKPFKEWITVYYDPKKITEEELLALLRKRRCPRTSLDRPQGGALTVMNPQVGAGDVVQLRLEAGKKAEPAKLMLPEGWSMSGDPDGFSGPDDVTWFTVQVPPKASEGMHKIHLDSGESGRLKVEVEVVRKVGS